MENKSKPAHPITEDAKNRIYSGETFNGLTKREHLAGLAMQSIRISQPSFSSSLVAKLAIEDADELLKELDK